MLSQAESFREAANPYGQRVCGASTHAVTHASRILKLTMGDAITGHDVERRTTFGGV